MLVCSFLGGMRAVTWTQVGQYIILVIAYLVPVVWLSVKHTGSPVPQVSAGIVLQQVAEKESYLLNDTGEIEVRRIWQERADEMGQRIAALPESWTLEKDKLRSRLAQLNATDAPMVEIRSLERELASYPPNAEEARAAWSQSKALFEARAAPPTPHAEPFPAKDAEERSNMRTNFLALVLCLMLGTAGMPHILMRSYTTPSVSEARRSVCWSLLFILLLYFMAPALALLVKYEVYTQVVGSNFLSLPNCARLERGRQQPAGRDRHQPRRHRAAGRDQHGADVVVLAMPEIGGLPYVISGLVAAGELAAARPPPTACC